MRGRKSLYSHLGGECRRPLVCAAGGRTGRAADTVDFWRPFERPSFDGVKENGRRICYTRESCPRSGSAARRPCYILYSVAFTKRSLLVPTVHNPQCCVRVIIIIINIIIRVGTAGRVYICTLRTRRRCTHTHTAHLTTTAVSPRSLVGQSAGQAFPDGRPPARRWSAP